jgi:hypothetical protein
MEKNYIKNFESFKSSKNTEPVNEELLGAIGKAVGAIFKKGKELINKAKGGKEVEAIYQKYLKMVQDQFASQAKVSLNIMASEKGTAKPIQNAANVIPKKESVDLESSDKLFEADANTKLAVDTLKQKKAALDQILQKLKGMALKEMDAVLKKYGGSAKNPKLDLLIQSKKDEFDLAYLNAQINYLEQAGDTTMVANIKKERDGIATKIEKELAQADTAVAVEYKEGDEVIHLLKGKTKENYDPKKKPEDQKDIVGVHKISKIEGDKYTLLDDEEKPTIVITGAELVGKPAEVPGKEEATGDYKKGDTVFYKREKWEENKAQEVWDKLTDEEKKKTDEGKIKELIDNGSLGVKKIEDVANDKVKFLDKDGKPMEKELGDIIGKTEEVSDANEDAEKAKEELAKIKDDPEKMKNVSSYAEFLRKGKPEDVDTIKGMVEDELGKLPKEG